MRVPRQEQPKARIEIIPMIDVIFFLLVFFMVSTLSMTINRGLPGEPPHRRHLTEGPAGESQSNVDAGWGNLPQQGTDHPARPRAPGQGRSGPEPELMVIINADGDVRHQAVVEAMDELRIAACRRLAIAVRTGRKARP